MPRPDQASLTITRDAADDLREVKALISRGRERVPTLSDVIRSLVDLWRQSQAGT
ncbi:MAG TPA: hypothetical protein VIX86_04645 [Streptosporangiaceae bacterium]